MRCSVFTVLDEHPELRAVRGGDRYEEAIALAKDADRLGFDTFWVAEHHFNPGGVLPSPPIWLAAAARETRRIRLGSMVSVLPLHRPRELAEMYALVDHLSQGRLEIGLGSGYVPTELQGFGVLPSERRQLFDAALPEFLAALEGKDLPVPGDPCETVRLNVLPLQRPRPPIWMAVQSREALPHVARLGVSIGLIPYASVNSLAELQRNIGEFQAAVPAGQHPRIAPAFHVYVGDDEAVGREALQRYFDTRVQYHRGTRFESQARSSPGSSTAQSVIDQELALVGTASKVRRQLKALREIGVTEMMGIFDFGGLEPTRVRASIKLFADIANVHPPRSPQASTRAR